MDTRKSRKETRHDLKGEMQTENMKPGSREHVRSGKTRPGAGSKGTNLRKSSDNGQGRRISARRDDLYDYYF